MLREFRPVGGDDFAEASVTELQAVVHPVVFAAYPGRPDIAHAVSDFFLEAGTALGESSQLLKHPWIVLKDDEDSEPRWVRFASNFGTEVRMLPPETDAAQFVEQINNVEIMRNRASALTFTLPDSDGNHFFESHLEMNLQVVKGRFALLPTGGMQVLGDDGNPFRLES